MSARPDSWKVLETDKLTGLLNRQSFCAVVERAIRENPSRAAEGGFAVICFDVVRFKAINELFGVKRGDKLLQYIASVLTQELEEGEFACRMDADHFAVFMRNDDNASQRMMDVLSYAIAEYELPIETTFNAGIYLTCAEPLTADAMMDRASLARSAIKGSYTVKYRYYDESLRSEMLSEHEIEGMSSAALRGRQFKVYYQPQYSHSTGELIGAEALARWQHPERGVIMPGVFIPIFERNGFIFEFDLYVFEQVCDLQRRCIDEGLHIVPISVNFSRYDVFSPDFVEKLEALRTAHGVPAKSLCIELTESVFIAGDKNMAAVIDKLHACGYSVQIDDFGSGYSSLNVLKDMEVDCFKLDMAFLSGSYGSDRGGTILSAVVRMARWLDVRVIAEGVETREQADFLGSIGCDYVQGYLYARPAPEADYLVLLRQGSAREIVCPAEAADMQCAVDFFDPNSQETLMFSNFMGPAAIFEYQDGKVEVLRVNHRYLAEIGMNQTAREVIGSDPLAVFDEENRRIYMRTIDEAIASGEEKECGTWRNEHSACCGSDRMYIRSTVRVIGRNKAAYLFFGTIRNITRERQEMERLLDNERRFRVASEQANIYYWEYDVATREMRPCLRCMRDLGIPAVLTNYPESAFDRGIFPPEVHELYRSWHKQVAAGVPELEAILPLTENRIPFRVRYTTEFDAAGHPVKAYGSAALVMDAAARPAELDKTSAGDRRTLELIAQHSDRVVLLYDAKTHRLRYSDVIDDQYGLHNSSIDALLESGRIVPESIENVLRIMSNVDKGVPYGRESIVFRFQEDFFCWLDVKYTTIFDDDKKATGAFLSYIDITEQVDALRRSNEDGMTGLLNRATAEQKIRGHVQSGAQPGVLVLMDMDGLKRINDTYGHREGDRAICSVAQLLKTHFRSSDIIGRFGGDEFAAFLSGAAGNGAAIGYSVQALLGKVMNLKVGNADQERLQCSVGCAEQKEDMSFDELYRRADKALYYAKRHGKNQMAFYEEAMDAGAYEPRIDS